MAIRINNDVVIDNSKNINAGIVTATGVTASSNAVLPAGNVAARVATQGSIRYNSEYSFLEFYNGTSWLPILASQYVTNPTNTGVFGGGYSGAENSGGGGELIIDYITIASTGNATNFGALTVARTSLYGGGAAACSSSTRGVFGGGFSATLPSSTLISYKTMDYITIATTGNATYFGDLTVARNGLAACSSSTRGVFGGGFGFEGPTYYNTMDYITIATAGNATDFGDLTVARNALAACSSSTRGVFGGGGAGPSDTNTMDYITIATAGNATDFGDLTVVRNALAACSSSTRGVFGGGYDIDYITIASTGNATNFGDLTVYRDALAACSSSTRGVFGGGFDGPGPSYYNTIDYITIASTGNATDFGDLAVARGFLAACSSSHGGL
jgi:hypothetical protein